MKQKTRIFLFIFLVITLFSCRREDLAIKRIVFQPYLHLIDPSESSGKTIVSDTDYETSDTDAGTQSSDLIDMTDDIAEDTTDTDLTYDSEILKNVSMGLSVYVYADVPDINQTNMELSSPDGSLRWSFIPKSVDYNGTKYYGTSSVSMPLGCLLPQGLWKLSLMYKDGRCVEQTFRVYYRNIAVLIKEASGADKPFYSSITNLTYLP